MDGTNLGKYSRYTVLRAGAIKLKESLKEMPDDS
jgi:hypothetical protein